MTRKDALACSLVVLLIAFTGLIDSTSRGASNQVKAPPAAARDKTKAVADLPDFEASKFTNPTQVDNAWFPLRPGTRFTWKGTSVDKNGDVEAHSVLFVVTDLTKEIGGVQTIVCWDRDFVDGELEEAEIIFFAQDDRGNVWHFGQYPEEYSDGKIEAAPGWLHGVRDGRAGIHMPTNPRRGDASFSQGWAPSVPWTDRAQVRESGRIVSVATGTYKDVLVFDEWNAEEPLARQQKYYARGVGNIKVGFSGEEDSKEELELVRIDRLNEEELAEAHRQAMKLDDSARKHCQNVFGSSKPVIVRRQR